MKLKNSSIKKFIAISSLSVMTSMVTSTASAQEDSIFNLQKRNTNFSIDGNRGAIERQQVYLWNTDNNNVNQQWVETEVGNGFHSYRKQDTSLCLDGGNNGSNLQAVILFPCDSGNRNQHWEKIDQAGGSTRLKKRGVSFSIDGGNGAARRNNIYLFRSGDSNVNQHWVFRTVGTTDSGSTSSSSSSSGSGDFNLDPSAPPWENFDLSEWRIDTPERRSSSSGDRCRTFQTDPEEYEDRSTDGEEYFFTHTDGGMRFVTEVGGATTGNNCDSRTRSELREMLRGTDTSISDDGDGDSRSDRDFRNNWALGYQPQTADAEFTWGAREGRMTATLRVNQVTTEGNSSNVGRTVIGQIHAGEDEPLRLNYRHRPGFEGGCIYASSEQSGGDDTDELLVGGSVSCNDDPGDEGIALGELFSYIIENDGPFIDVTIYRGVVSNDNEINSVRFDLSEDGIDGRYDTDTEWMYFKAGAYTQNERSTGARTGDADIVTFYRLDVEH